METSPDKQSETRDLQEVRAPHVVGSRQARSPEDPPATEIGSGNPSCLGSTHPPAAVARDRAGISGLVMAKKLETKSSPKASFWK